MKSSLPLFAALLLHAANVLADARPLASIADPAGDDYGAGTLVYPQRSDFRRGDLDILRLQISRDSDGFWFEATFKNPIRNPANVPNAVGAESLADFARNGFYQFNIDVYVDTDRIKGSGNTFTLPGRHVAIAPEDAWEKAVVLTPRPEVMRQQLLDAATEQFPDQGNAKAIIGQSIYFPTRIRISDKSIAFFVPAAFFAGSDGTDWAVTAFVTGAMTNVPLGFSLFPAGKPPLERIDLGVMQPTEGYPRDTFGYGGSAPAPVVDVVGGSAEQQVRELASRTPLSGVSWGPHAVKEASASVAGRAPAPVPVDSIAGLFLPSAPAQPAAPGAAAPAGRDEQSIARRLQTLQQLLDQHLIDEAEYKRQKERILNEL